MSIISAPTIPLTVGDGLAPIELPPLENGDRLTRAEFRRRWQAMPQLKRAELVEGVVYMAAAIRHRQHGQPHRRLIGWIDRYITDTPGIDGGDNATISLDDRNDPQPDAYLLLPPALGGRALERGDGFLQGPPALVAEVAASSSGIDLHDKFRVYQQHGVQEYIVWRVLDRAIDWFVLEGEAYRPLAAVADGIHRSRVFPGLWLDATAMIAGSAKQVYAVLDQGLASPEHTDFVARLGAT